MCYSLTLLLNRLASQGATAQCFAFEEASASSKHGSLPRKANTAPCLGDSCDLFPSQISASVQQGSETWVAQMSRLRHGGRQVVSHFQHPSYNHCKTACTT